MVKKRNNQRSTCPDGWEKAGIRMPVHLTVKQTKYAARCVGIARAVYNHMVHTHKVARSYGGPWPSPMEMEKVFNGLKREVWVKDDSKPKDAPDNLDEDPHRLRFTTEVSKFVAQGACRDFRRAYENWLDKTLKARKPRFKKRNHNGTGSFLAASGIHLIRYDGNRRIRLPYIGSVKLAQQLPPGIPYEVRISKKNGQWNISINYWKPPVTENKTYVFGAVDVGINPLAVDSELTHYENPKALYQHQRQLQRWQRTQSRRTPGSKGWQEAQRRINSLHKRINGLRSNAHHQLSRHLVRKFAVLAIESLNVAAMDKLPNQAKAIRDAAIGGLLDKIRYKAQWYGTIIVEADQFFPSSKLCSDCGYHNADLGRELRWECPACGYPHDRNDNAALNLLGVAMAVDDLPDQLILGPVGPDVTLLDGRALAADNHACGETNTETQSALACDSTLKEGRPAVLTRASAAVDTGKSALLISEP